MRLNRVINRTTGKTLIVPFDHGTSAGVLNGLDDVENIVNMSVKGGADAIMLRPALMKNVVQADYGNLGIILCLTGRLDRGVDHVEYNTVDYAIQCGADCICAEFKLGSDGDLENSSLASLIAEKAHEKGMPVMMTIYAQKKFIQKFGDSAYGYACRVGEELGADIVKTSVPCDNKEIIKSCVDSVSIPLVLAGGSNVKNEVLYSNIENAISMGFAGAAVGRNVWGCKNGENVVSELKRIIHSK